MQHFKWRFFLCLLILTIVPISCSNDDEPAMVDTEEMPITLVIPKTDYQTKSVGDPGEGEAFVKPRYAYVYLYSNYRADDGTVTEYPVQCVKATLDEALWEENNNLYEYRGKLSVAIPNQRTEGKFYVAVSPVDINPRLVVGATSEEQIQAVEFDVGDDARNSLRDIYSSPYNYEKNERYYGTINDFSSKVPQVEIVLYHVAARVDLMWNVASDLQSTVALRSITAKGLKSKSCLLFKPMDNTKSVDDQGYSQTLTLDVGSMWYGRDYIYAIPYKDSSGNFSLTLDLENNSSVEKMQTTTIPLQGIDIFTPWMRGTINITNDIWSRSE